MLDHAVGTHVLVNDKPGIIAGLDPNCCIGLHYWVQFDDDSEEWVFPEEVEAYRVLDFKAGDKVWHCYTHKDEYRSATVDMVDPACRFGLTYRVRYDDDPMHPEWVYPRHLTQKMDDDEQVYHAMWPPVSNTLDRPIEDNSGLNANYYVIPEGCTQVQDIIEHKNMNFSEGNILKAIYRLGSKDQVSRKYDLEKIVYFAQREIARIDRA